MSYQLEQVQPFVYTNPQGLCLEVLFVLDPEKRGYINATAIAAQFEREPTHWLRNRNVQEYINALIDKINSHNIAKSLKTLKPANLQVSMESVTYDDLVIIAEGAPENGGGTWLHPKLGIIFARWLSPHFAVWCDEQIADLLQQYPEHQQLFPELSQVLDKITEYQQQADQRFYAMEQHIQAAEQRLGQYINQRFCAIEQHMRATEQRTEQRLDTNEQALNRFHERSLQENRHNLGQIYKNIQKIEKALYQQHQGDLLQPSVAEMLKEVLLEYQQFLKQMLHQNQDELTQRIDQIVQQLPVQPAAPQPLTAEPLAAEIAALRADGQSWKAIAENLNTNGIQTVSGKGKWHGSSVKKYLDHSNTSTRECS